MSSNVFDGFGLPKDLVLTKEPINQVSVRWWDGYLEEFQATEVRAGAYLLWMRLTNGLERSIPLLQVRWYSRSIESHQNTGVNK